jgi:dolichol-phosphate mannosyltransferase
MVNGQGIELSIVVPVLNEADNLMPLYEEICHTVNDRYNCEILFIDDGSTEDYPFSEEFRADGGLVSWF